MLDTFDADPNTLPPLNRTVVAASRFATTTGPVASERALRALLDGVHNLEQRVITLENGG